MKSKKRILTILIILFIALLIILGVYMSLVKNSKENHKYMPIDEIKLEETLQPVKTRNSYYTAKNSVEKFYTYYMSIFDIDQEYYERFDQETINEIEKQNIDIVYNMLDKEYIEAKQVTNSNLKTNLIQIKSSIIDITDMYVCQQENNIEAYVVKGFLEEKTTENIKPFQIIVKLDIYNNTFSILPQEYVEEQYKNLTVGEKIEFKNSEAIQENKNNTLNSNVISDETYVKDIFNQFKREIQNFGELAYNNLNEEYRNKKFKTLEEFKIYLSNKNQRYSTMQLEKYQKTEIDEYTQYVCIDTNGNYYIFNETAVMDYTVILDTYTIDLPEFTEKYNTATEQQKVALNIDRFIQAINDGDYKYAYSCLADSYKQNNFKTQQEFETYAKQKFYASSSVGYKEFNMQGDVYTYSVVLTDKTGGQQMNKTFIMQLGEGTEFVLSFDK